MGIAGLEAVAVVVSAASGFTFLTSWAQIVLAILAGLTAVLAALAPQLSRVVVRCGLAIVVVLGMTTILVGAIDKPPPSPKTQLIIMRVYGDDGELLPGFRIAGTTTARDVCIRSIRSGDIDALRCFGTDHVVYDPCWIDLHGMGACLEDPWSRDVVRVRSARPEPHPSTRDPGTFWALELGNGERCTFAGGTKPIVAGMRINYDCSNGGGAGDPDRSGPQWVIPYNKRGSTEVVQVPIRRAWL